MLHKSCYATIADGFILYILKLHYDLAQPNEDRNKTRVYPEENTKEDQKHQLGCILTVKINSSEQSQFPLQDRSRAAFI